MTIQKEVNMSSKPNTKAEELPLVALSALRKQIAFMPKENVFLLHLTSEAQVNAANWALHQIASEMGQPWIHEGKAFWYTISWAYATAGDGHLEVVELNTRKARQAKGVNPEHVVSVVYRVMFIQHERQVV
jgi:hypothetical protein